MPVSEHQVIDALRDVHDPELGASIVDLGMVKQLEIVGPAVTVTVALTVSGCPLRHEIDNRVRSAVGGLDGVESVTVNQAVMSPEELAGLRSRLRGPEPEAWSSSSRSQGQRLGHEEGRANPFSAPSSRTRIVGVSSGKGGVGKSTVAVNLAVALAATGRSVGLLDADVYGFSVPAMLGVAGAPTMGDGKVVPPEAFGVRVISMGFFVPDDQPVIWRGPLLHKTLEQFLVDVDWGDPDFLLIDMPPGTGDVALSMAQYLPVSEVYVVTTPQPAARRVAQRSAYMAKKLNLPLRGVIENMSWFRGPDGARLEIFGSGGGAQLAHELGVPLLGQIPLVPALRQGGDEGVPLVVSQPTSEAGEALRAIAQSITEQSPARAT